MQDVITAFYVVKTVKMGFVGDRKIVKAGFMEKVKWEPDLAGQAGSRERDGF